MVVTVPNTRGHGVRDHSFPPLREGWTIEVRGHCLQALQGQRTGGLMFPVP